MKRTVINLFDVSAAGKSDAGNGHSYFRQSPRASSDLLLNVMYGSGPWELGLERTEEIPVWPFPRIFTIR
jgi:hypothetical protein